MSNHIAGPVRQMINDHPNMGLEEKRRIRLALNCAEMFGYGNLMAWVATEWAVRLRDKEGMSEEAAIDMVSNRGPYTLPPKP